MNAVRYWVALLVLVSLPPGILLWYFIHPLASFWRKLGPGWTYTILGVPMLALMAAVFLARDTLLAVDLGTSYPLIALAALTLAAAATIAMKRKRHLTFGILAGVPELSRRRHPGKLLTEGPYARIRHPRYVETFLWILAYALFANYLATYVVAGLTIPALWLVVVLEERELRQRFGAEYEGYCRRVPRFLPPLRR